MRKMLEVGFLILYTLFIYPVRLLPFFNKEDVYGSYKAYFMIKTVELLRIWGIKVNWDVDDVKNRAICRKLGIDKETYNMLRDDIFGGKLRLFWKGSIRYKIGRLRSGSSYPTVSTSIDIDFSGEIVIYSIELSKGGILPFAEDINIKESYIEDVLNKLLCEQGTDCCKVRSLPPYAKIEGVCERKEAIQILWEIKKYFYGKLSEGEFLNYKAEHYPSVYLPIYEGEVITEILIGKNKESMKTEVMFIEKIVEKGILEVCKEHKDSDEICVKDIANNGDLVRVSTLTTISDSNGNIQKKKYLLKAPTKKERFIFERNVSRLNKVIVIYRTDLNRLEVMLDELDVWYSGLGGALSSKSCDGGIEIINYKWLRDNVQFNKLFRLSLNEERKFKVNTETNGFVTYKIENIDEEEFLEIKKELESITTVIEDKVVFKRYLRDMRENYRNYLLNEKGETVDSVESLIERFDRAKCACFKYI